MTGTIINFASILLGGFIGLLAGNRIPQKFRETLVSALGLFTLAYGVSISIETENILIPLGSLVLGTIFGELLKLEDKLNDVGKKLHQKLEERQLGNNTEASRFITGFVTSSLLFCIGPMAILGSIQDGLSGNFQMLAIKSLLDGLAAMAFASTLGVGVLFSSIMVLIYQGAISITANLIGKGFDASIIAEMTAVGGIILIGISLSNLLAVKKIRTGSFLPALIFAVLIVIILRALGITYS